MLLVRLRCSCWGTRSLLSVVYLFLSLTGGTRFAQTPPVGRSENLTGSSFLLQWSSATNPCIFCLYYSSKEGEEKEIRKPLFHSVPVFQIKISFPCSDNGSLRCSCSGTIGALASVVLLFLNDRPMVSERSEFRRSVKEKARWPTEVTGSPNTNTADE